MCKPFLDIFPSMVIEMIWIDHRTVFESTWCEGVILDDGKAQSIRKKENDKILVKWFKFKFMVRIRVTGSFFNCSKKHDIHFNEINSFLNKSNEFSLYLSLCVCVCDNEQCFIILCIENILLMPEWKKLEQIKTSMKWQAVRILLI